MLRYLDAEGERSAHCDRLLPVEGGDALPGAQVLTGE